MKTYSRAIMIFLIPFFINFSSFSEEAWREKMKDQVYSPLYFGPSAFPIPQINDGRVATRFEVEFRGQYHTSPGDKTRDLFTRGMVPVVKGKVALEVSFLIIERYRMTKEERDRRVAVGPEKNYFPYNGDVVVSCYFQVLKKEEWADIMVSMNLKTASGGDSANTRFTDAATYWFDVNMGKTLFRDQNETWYLRAQASIGFYCWMTNDVVNRQNDAISFGGGLSGKYRNLTLQSDFAGFNGYLHNGDHPLILRNVINYEYKKNILSFRYNHGVRDFLFDTYSIGLIRCF